MSLILLPAAAHCEKKLYKNVTPQITVEKSVYFASVTKYYSTYQQCIFGR